MENTKLSLQLIRNTYEADDAKDVIMQLLCDKTNFLGKQIFSLEERYGIDSPFLENRLKELNQCKADLEQFFENMNKEEMEVRINCPINIELVKSETKTNPTAKNNEESAWT